MKQQKFYHLHMYRPWIKKQVQQSSFIHQLNIALEDCGVMMMIPEVVGGA